MDRLPGLSWDDAFARELAATAGDQPVRLVAVCPGRSVERSVSALQEEVAARGEFSYEVVSWQPSAGANEESFLACLARALDWTGSERGRSPEDLAVVNAGRLKWPRLVVVAPPKPTTATAIEAAAELASRFAAATKDLDGPVYFVFLFRLLGRLLPEGNLIWEPVAPTPEPLPFWRPGQPLLSAGFRNYLTFRAYWEAGGQPDYLERFAGVLGQEGALVAAQDADASIDGFFDRLGIETADPDLLAAQFADAFDRDNARATLKSGIIVHSRIPLEALQATGLAWCPPGSPRPALTPVAAKALTRCRGFVSEHLLAPGSVAALRRAARRNPLLSAWVADLASHVERELMARCQRDSDLPQLLQEHSLTASLVRERESWPRHFAYDASDDLITYASFGDLQSLVTRTRLAAQFPVSAKRVNQVRQVRNLTAHQHPVTWRAARCVIEALQQLVAQN